MKEWVPLNADGTAWRLNATRIVKARQAVPWEVWELSHGFYFWRWTDPYMAGAARVAEALEQLAADGARITTA